MEEVEEAVIPSPQTSPPPPLTKKQKLDECQEHIVEWLTRHEMEGGMGFRDFNFHPADRDMADAVAASVMMCVEGLCPTIREADPDAPLLDSCPIYEHFTSRWAF